MFHSVYSIRRETSRRIYVVQGETDKTASDIQARSFMARALDKSGKECKAEGKAKNGPMKNRNLIMPENYEEFISLTLRTRNSKKPLRMLARNWKHQWLLPCLARHARRASMGKPVTKPMSSNQNFRIYWKPENPQDCVWKNLYRIIMRSILHEKVTIHCSITILFTNLFLCLKS